jgi:hypothetical protein
LHLFTVEAVRSAFVEESMGVASVIEDLGTIASSWCGRDHKEWGILELGYKFLTNGSCLITSLMETAGSFRARSFLPMSSSETSAAVGEVDIYGRGRLLGVR